MRLQHQIDSLQAQRASEWFELLKRGDAQDAAAFEEWCRKSPLHLQEFLEITWTDRALEGLDAHREIDLEALVREVAGSVQILPHRSVNSEAPISANGRGTRWVHRWRWSLAAAVAVLAIGIAGYWQIMRQPQEFSTKIGELRTVELTDTSTVTLNTDSDIQIQFERDARNIELRHGEAVFRVAHDPSRPFRVHTLAGVVQAIGTQFNVYARADGTDVAVLEGRVRLTPRTVRGAAVSAPEELKAGEQAWIGLDGSVHRIEHADVERATAWSKRRLKFDETPLEDMVREFNRYHRNLQLRLENISPGSHHYSGIFDVGDPEMLASFLENEPDLMVERRRGEIIIRSRHAVESTVR